MVDRKIRLLWNNGGGSATKIVTHNVTIESATSRGNLLTNEHMWYKITAERTGNIGRLNVRKVRPVSICPKSLNFNFTLRYKREYRPPCAGFPQKQVFYLFFFRSMTTLTITSGLLMSLRLLRLPWMQRPTTMSMWEEPQFHLTSIRYEPIKF